ncbi:MAG TPA: hypothetical protein VMY34_05155 [Acidimicrobiales bacterium]|nr:hypothetical protein [Acidimicrobiales bacterium]
MKQPPDMADLPDDPVGRVAEIDARLGRARWPRYRFGWNHYVDAACPADHAEIVVDNDELADPLLPRTA